MFFITLCILTNYGNFLTLVVILVPYLRIPLKFIYNLKSFHCCTIKILRLTIWDLATKSWVIWSWVKEDVSGPPPQAYWVARSFNTSYSSLNMFMVGCTSVLKIQSAWITNQSFYPQNKCKQCFSTGHTRPILF